MTNEPEMTLIRAREIVEAANKESISSWHGITAGSGYRYASGFIAGHAVASKEAEVYKAALENIIQHMQLVSGNMADYSTVSRIAKEALSKGSKPCVE